MKNVLLVDFVRGTKNIKHTDVIYEDVLKILCSLNIKVNMLMESGNKRTILRRK